MKDIIEVRGQPLSSLVADFVYCPCCKVVDRDRNRRVFGYKCPQCKMPSLGASFYFPATVWSLVDLMQDSYHPGDKKTLEKEEADRSLRNHRLAVVVFFCTLGEVLLHHFLEEYMSSQGLPPRVQQRLLSDNRFVKERVKKLFPDLVGISWKEDVRSLGRDGGIDYEETVNFFIDTVNKRNSLLHSGNKWIIRPDLPEQCVRHIWPLLCLFVALHNKHLANPLAGASTSP